MKAKKQGSTGWLNPAFRGHYKTEPSWALFFAASRLQRWLNTSTLLHYPHDALGAREAVGLVSPIFVIAQEVTLVPEIHGRPQEKPSYAEVTHPLKSAVGGIDTAADNRETLSL